MYNKRKMAYQANRITLLEKTIQELEQENKILRKENQEHKRVLEIKDAGIDKIKKEFDAIHTQYMNSIQELQKLRNNYKEAISRANEARSIYSKEMRQAIQRIRKPK